jgi:hypothetical protein
MKTSSPYGLVLVSRFIAPGAVADTVQHTSSLGSYPNVTSGLFHEFGLAGVLPQSEAALWRNRMQGDGPATLSLRISADTGSFLFDRIQPADVLEGVAALPSQVDHGSLSVKGLTTQGAQNLEGNIDHRLTEP